MMHGRESGFVLLPVVRCGRRRCCVRGCVDKPRGTSEGTSPIVKGLVSGLTVLVSGLPRGRVDVEEDERDGDRLDARDVLVKVKEDYERRNYFISGDISEEVYMRGTEFVDPTVSVKGLENWARNIRAINGFLREGEIQLMGAEWDEDEDVIRTRWHLICTLNLPWRPVIDIFGRTDHYLDAQSGRIRKHVESWDISAVEALGQLFRPRKNSNPNSDVDL